MFHSTVKYGNFLDILLLILYNTVNFELGKQIMKPLVLNEQLNSRKKKLEKNTFSMRLIKW